LKKQTLHKYFAVSIIAFLLVACSVEKNTLVNRSYHNLTAHYNVYFNGNEAMKMGLLKIESQMEEDYTKILPIYKESLPNSEKLVSNEMTTAIEKGTKLIRLHSMTKPPVSKNKSGRKKKEQIKPEYNRWVDDAYIMIARGYLYKKEHIMAISTLQMAARKYKDTPEKYNINLWLIRCLGEADRFSEAQQQIHSLENDKAFPKNLEGELAIAAADVHMKQQQFDEAIHKLNIGIKKIKGNKRKSRYTFILGQLYQETGKNEQALIAYQQVIRRGPEYTLLFNARIKSAEVFSGDGNIADLRKELNKMRRSKWNEPYLDQIYYALGNISFNEGKIDDAVELYKKSVAVSKNNIHQRALSSITIGDILFDRKEYIPAGEYYDTAMVIVDETYPNYPIVLKKYEQLSNLVTNLKTVVKEDSLLYLASLSQADLDKKIQDWIELEKKKVDSENESQFSSDDPMTSYYRANSNRMRMSNTGSSFYFYNTSTISYGKKDFSRIWGERKNEDNWRRRNKSSSSFDEDSEASDEQLAEELEVEEELRINDPTTPEYYTQDIPLTDSMKQASHIRIQDALFGAGASLKSDFNDYDFAVKNINDLNSRYSVNQYQPISFFYLWDMHTLLNNPDSANYYKQLIISDYPESNYAKYLTNPNFFIEEAMRKDSINNYYNQAFNHFRNRNYYQALQASNKTISMMPDTSIMGKAQFIRVISESKDFPKERFADSLKVYIVTYPKASPIGMANKILELIRNEKFANYQQLVESGYLNDFIRNNELLRQSVQTGNDELLSKWDADDELLHYFVIAFPNDTQIDVNRLKFDIANYNLDHYISLDFDIENEVLNQDTKLLIVRNFNDKESAMVYFLSITKKPEVFKTLAGKPYLNFIASNMNYRQILNDRNYNDYIPFFAKNYNSLATGKFSDKELESPEALMARLKQDPAGELREQGQYVVVETADPNYVAPVREQLYTPGYDEPHSVTILFRQKNAGTGYLMRDLIKLNAASHREKRLRVVPGRLKENTLLSVSTFENAWEANEYLKSLREMKDLFTSLGTIKYELFIISDANLTKLIQTDNIEEWSRFYNINYIRRTPQAPPKPETKTEVTPENTQSTGQVPAAEIQKSVTEEKPVENLAVQPEARTTETAVDPTPVTEAILVEQETKTPDETIVSDGMFAFDATEKHQVVYMLPVSSSNYPILNTYLERLITLKYRSEGVSLAYEPLDDIRVMMVVKGLANKERATQFMEEARTDQRISMALRSVNHKTYLISDSNFLKLKESKDLSQYQLFHDQHY
jgi:tetratricopeptide (TPR) repeat protein